MPAGHQSYYTIARGSLDGVVVHGCDVRQEHLLGMLHHLGQIAHEPAIQKIGSFRHPRLIALNALHQVILWSK